MKRHQFSNPESLFGTVPLDWFLVTRTLMVLGFTVHSWSIQTQFASKRFLQIVFRQRIALVLSLSSDLFGRLEKES